MKTLEKILKVMLDNFMYTLVLLIAIVLFAWFSNGLLYGLISALSAIVAYACIVYLYKEYNKKPSKK